MNYVCFLEYVRFDSRTLPLLSLSLVSRYLGHEKRDEDAGAELDLIERQFADRDDERRNARRLGDFPPPQ